jgi:hypothetical protein
MAVSIVANTLMLLVCLALGLRIYIAEHRLQNLQNDAMPCFEDEALVWESAPSAARCVPLDNLLHELLNDKLVVK